jgi:uroporphyrinogen-III synthase
MSKHTNFIKDIYGKTQTNKIQWKLDVASRYDDVIFSSQLAFRCFSTNLKSSGESYDLLLIEKKAPELNEDSGITSDVHHCELSILKGRQLVITLTEEHVGRRNLMDLLEVVEDTNSDAEKLFKDYE